MIPPDPTFTWDGQTLRYADHEYNDTLQNERAVELPIVREWLYRHWEDCDGSMLEVGNVLGHYNYPDAIRYRQVVDRWERAPGVWPVDVFDVPSGWSTIVSISTLEHVRWDEEPRQVDGAERAFLHLCGALAPGGRMLVTVPFGHHKMLDAAILDAALPVDRQWTMVRASDGSWVEHPDEAVWAAYGSLDRWAAAVWIGEVHA